MLAEGRALCEATASRHELLHSEVFKVRLDQRLGDDAAAAARFAVLLPELRRIGDHRCITRCLLGLGQAAIARREGAAAREQLAECVVLSAESGLRAAIAEGRAAALSELCTPPV